jgi:xanthine dehydrogenase accessory factor
MAAMDMICGGSVEVLLDPLAPAPEHIAIFERWSRMAVEGGEGAFVSAILCAEQGRIAHIDHALVEADGRLHGRLPLSDAGRKALAQAVRTATAMVTMTVEDLFMIVEPIRPPQTVYLVGAGHVSQPTAHLAALVGFRVVVFDDRLAFANRERFPDADEVRVLADFEHPFDSLAIDTHSFIVIITRGHLYDKVVLSRALRTNAGYIGMIGSLRKREAIFGSLLKEGFSQADLARVHSPIGLDIAAETPAEIAVSIVAEMIRERRRR